MLFAKMKSVDVVYEWIDFFIASAQFFLVYKKYDVAWVFVAAVSFVFNQIEEWLIICTAEISDMHIQQRPLVLKLIIFHNKNQVFCNNFFEKGVLLQEKQFRKLQEFAYCRAVLAAQLLNNFKAIIVLNIKFNIFS